MSISVSKAVRNTIGLILSDQNIGFNTTLGSVCEGYNIPAFTLDYSAKSKNFYNGWYGIKDVMATTNMKFPLQTLYTMRSQNTNETKFLTFSGSVQVGIDTYISFPQSAAPNDTETILDAVEATMYSMFNSETAMPLFAAGGVIYNADVQTNRAPLTLNGSNWLTFVQSRLTVDFEA